jgi:hypothetical protein
MAEKLNGAAALRASTLLGITHLKMIAPRRSARIAAKMATPVTQPLRRSARLAAPVAAPVAAVAAPVAAPVPVAPVAQPLRRSARLAARTQSYPSHGVSPSHWANRTFTGLTWGQCRKLDENIAQVREYLGAVDLETSLVNRAECVIRLFQYLYHNELLVLRNPRFRATVMNKLEEILNNGSTMAKITPTQSRILRTQHKLWEYKYTAMTTHPLYVA